MRLYKVNETLEYTYYQMPQELFENGKYKCLSIEAKVIYTFLLNRMNLSKINRWINNVGEIYLIYTRKEIQSKPNLIYIGKIEHADLKINKIKENNYLEVDYIRLDNQTKEDCHIEENTINDTENLRTNKKKIIMEIMLVSQKHKGKS